jgi:hypothetical protein
MQGGDPYKLWFLNIFEVGLLVVRTSGDFDCDAGALVSISSMEIYF